MLPEDEQIRIEGEREDRRLMGLAAFGLVSIAFLIGLAVGVGLAAWL